MRRREFQRQPDALIAQRETQPPPALRQTRCHAQPLLDAYPGEALNHTEPDCARCGSMQTVITAVRIVTQIDLAPFSPEAVRGLRIVTARRHDAVDCLAERRVMNSARQISRQAGLLGFRRKQPRLEIEQHHHVGLLEDLHLVNFSARVIQQNRLLACVRLIAA